MNAENPLVEKILKAAGEIEIFNSERTNHLLRTHEEFLTEAFSIEYLSKIMMAEEVKMQGRLGILSAPYTTGQLVKCHQQVGLSKCGRVCQFYTYHSI